MEEESVKNVIVIGASAGGIAAVSRLAATFKEELHAAVFVVIHLSIESKSEVIIKFIQKRTLFKCKIAQDGERIRNGTLYLAPSGYHMLIERDYVLVRKGAYENRWRPAIDVLFRSAALAYNACVTGIILTGLLDDGTSGMRAIKKSGGKCIIQNPAEAEFPDMPENVLKNIDVDYSVSIDEMTYIILDLYSQDDCKESEVPDDVKVEASIALTMSSSVDNILKLGELSPFTCPDCGGTLVKIVEENVVRYRCYTGHAYTEKTLELENLKSLEESLWVAVRFLEERKNLLNTMVYGKTSSEEISIHIERLKSLMLEIVKNTEIN